MDGKNIKKIIITGDAGRGKSTLASKLAQKLEIPHYSTDDFYYEVKFTKMRSKEDSVRAIAGVYKGDKWIVEGATEHMIEAGLPHADLIVCLKHKHIFEQWVYLLKRHYFHRNKDTKSDIWEFMRHVYYKRYSIGYRRGQPTIHEFISPYKEKVVTLSSFREMEKFFNSLESND